MKKITKLISLLLIGFLSFVVANTTFNITPVFADDPSTSNSGSTTSSNSSTYVDVCAQQGVPQEVKDAAGCPGNPNSDLSTVIKNILNAIIGVAGIVSVIYIIIGGVQYMTSSGDAAKTQKAKNTILYAVIGLIVCALSFAIVNWTIDAISNSNANTTTNNSSTGTNTGP